MTRDRQEVSAAGSEGSVPRFLDATSERAMETVGLVAGAAAFVVVAVAALIAFGFESAPIAGPGSIGQFVAIASALVALPTVCAGRYVANAGRSHRELRFLDHLDIASLSIAHAIVALLGWTLLSVILAQAFLGATVFPLAVVLLAGGSAAMTAYIAFGSAVEMDARLLALLFGVFFLLGVLVSMLTASDPDWWKDNLSALGVTTNVSARAFNLTLIVSGLLVTALARFATRGLSAADAAGTNRVRACLVSIGVLLALVGVFPVNLFFGIHTGAATGMAVVFGVLVVRLPGWMRGLPPSFILLGRLFLAVTVLFGVLYAIGYYTLTAVELVAGALVFIWVILFIRNTAALQHDTQPLSGD